MKKNMHKNQKKLYSLLVVFLLIASIAMYAVAAKDGDSSSGSSSGSSDSSSSNSASSSSKSSNTASNDDVKKDAMKADDKNNANAKDDKNRFKIEVKNDKKKAEARDGNNKLKVEVKDDKNNQNMEVKVKAESKNGFGDIISRLLSFIFGKKTNEAEKAPEAAASAQASVNAQAQAGQGVTAETQENEAAAPVNQASAAAQAAGVIITGGVSGPGYPTGPLNLVVPSTQLFLDKVGQVKQGAQLEVKGRQYEVPLETIPPTTASIPITINGVANTANEIKVISNLKVKNGVGQHSGTIDVDIDVLPAAGHLTLQYSGTATVAGSTITSGGVFKTAKSTGIFAGLVAEGTYMMTIAESGSTQGAPATVTITTTSQ